MIYITFITLITTYIYSHNHIKHTLLSSCCRFRNRCLYKFYCINGLTLEHFSQNQVLVFVLEQREVTLDAVELGRVGYVEYGSYMKLLKQVFGEVGFVHREIVHEDGKRGSLKSL